MVRFCRGVKRSYTASRTFPRMSSSPLDERRGVSSDATPRCIVHGLLGAYLGLSVNWYCDGHMLVPHRYLSSSQDPREKSSVLAKR